MGRIKIIILVIAAFSAGIVSAQNDQSLIIKGNEHYKKQEFDKAAEAYKKAAEANEKNAKAQYNLGNALYQQKQREAAAKAFQAATESSTDKNFLARAFYNQGVSFTRDQKLQESIDAYKQSLRKNPTDQDTRENLQKALNELKKQQQQNQDQKNNQDNKDKNQDQEQKPQNKSKLNKNQVERMLNALRQEEQRLQQNKQSKTKSGGPQEKDW